MCVCEMHFVCVCVCVCVCVPASSPSQALIKTCEYAKAKGGIGSCEFCAGENMAKLTAANCTTVDFGIYCNSTGVY